MKPPVAMKASDNKKDAGVASAASAASPAANPSPNATPPASAEDQEVRAVVLDVRVELLAEQERDEPDQRQRAGDDPDQDDRCRTCAPSIPGARHPAKLGGAERRQNGSKNDPALVLEDDSVAGWIRVLMPWIQKIAPMA